MPMAAKHGRLVTFHDGLSPKVTWSFDWVVFQVCVEKYTHLHESNAYQNQNR